MRNLHLFSPGALTTIGANGAQQIIVTTALVPLGPNAVHMANAFASIAAADNSGKINIASVALFVILFDNGGTALSSEALPVNWSAALMPAVGVGSLRVVARRPMADFRFQTSSETGLGGIVAQVAVQTIVVAQNTDGAASHGVTVNVSGWFVFEDPFAMVQLVPHSTA